MSFFDTTTFSTNFPRASTPLMRRFPNVQKIFFTLFIVIDTIVVISYATPWFTIVIIPLTIMYLLIQVRIMYSITKLYFSCSDFFCVAIFLCGHFPAIKTIRIYQSITNLYSFSGNPSRSVCDKYTCEVTVVSTLVCLVFKRIVTKTGL